MQKKSDFNSGKEFSVLELVSVIMPAYNAAEFISESIESVLAQTYPHFELIVVDDGSVDNTAELVEQYSAIDGRVTLLTTQGRVGAAKARNLAIEYSHGRYVAFLDSDDLWLPKKLSTQLKIMQSKNCVLCFSSYFKMDASNNLKDSRIVTVPQHVTYNELLKGNVIGCLTAIYDTAYFGKKYMPEVTMRQDYGLWLKLLKKIIHEDYRLMLDMTRSVDGNVSTFGIEEPLAIYRVHAGSLSSNKLNAALSQWYIYREIEKLSFFYSVYCFMCYAYNGMIKYRK